MCYTKYDMEEQLEIKTNKTPDILSLIAMLTAILAIPLAIIFDIIAFKEVILQFIAALILPCIAFVVLCFFMIVTIIFIFGIFLIENYGFWPLTLSYQFFKEIIGDIKISQESLALFRVFRIILLVICLTVLILAIVSKGLAKADAEASQAPVKRSVKGKAKAAIVLSILGIIVSVGAIAITAAA